MWISASTCSSCALASLRASAGAETINTSATALITNALRVNNETPPRDKKALGISAPRRVPNPAAGIIAATRPVAAVDIRKPRPRRGLPQRGLHLFSQLEQSR